MQDQFMRRALEIAREAIDEPGALPFGAVVVKDGQIIGEGLNRSPKLNDPSSHGEVEAIRDACRRLGTLDLHGADVYTSCEPCSMCVTMMYMVGIRRLYYATTLQDSAAMLGRLAAKDPKWSRRISSLEIREQVGKAVGARTMPAEHQGGKEGLAVLADFETRQG